MKRLRLDTPSLLNAYAHGAFPMADDTGAIGWYTADPRGIIPLERFRISRSLRQAVNQRRFEIRINSCFEEVMRNCMLARESSWISDELIEAYLRLHRLGFAHSVEAWQGGQLAGGLYGVSLGAAFFGESMFHKITDASKVALVDLVERLRQRRFELLDTQASTAHLERFGCIEIPASEYMTRLSKAVGEQRSFA